MTTKRIQKILNSKKKIIVIELLLLKINHFKFCVECIVIQISLIIRFNRIQYICWIIHYICSIWQFGSVHSHFFEKKLIYESN